MPSAAQLAQKLNKHWTNIAHHLYLKHECPVPLPAVGPLAELLSVTRQVCTDINSQVSSGSLTAACVGTLVNDRGVKLLGKLVCWLQQQPHEQLLLNSEQQESLWQLLLVTLANLLRLAAQKDAAVAAAFTEQLQASGMLPGLRPALQWLLQDFPRRSLTATAGAWLLLQEVITSSTSSSSSNLSAAAPAAVGAGQQPVSADLGSSLLQFGRVLQAYIDQGYAMHRQPGSAGAGRVSAAGTPVKRASKNAGGSSGSGGGAETPLLRSSNSAEEAAAAAAAAAVAAAEDGSWRYSHPVALADDPSNSTCHSLLALLHCVQGSMLNVPMLPAAAASAPASSESTSGEQQPHQQAVLPARAFLQVIAIATTWLQEHSPAPPDSSSSSSSRAEPVPTDHLQALPLKDVTLAAACMLGLGNAAAALKLITRACTALSDGFFDLSVPNSDSAAAADNTATAPDAQLVDSVLGFKLLLESVVLLQRRGQCVLLALPLQQLAASARGCSREEMQQLVTTRGKLLLQVLSDYLMHAPEGQQQQQQKQQQEQQEEAGGQQQQQQLDQGRGFEQQPEGFGTDNAERCVLVAHVLIQLCPGRLAGAAGLFCSHGIVDDQLLGTLTEQDPACFYQIMDHLVRHVQPANLQVLLPMSASFLTRSLTAEDAQQQLEQQQQLGDGSDSSSNDSDRLSGTKTNGCSGSGAVTSAQLDAAAIGGRLLSGNHAIRTKKSMVILSDYAVCRSFAAALHGYSKSVVGPVLSQQQQQDAGAASRAAANGDRSSEQQQQQQQQWYVDHDTPVHYVLPPLQEVAEWLAVGLEDAIIAAMRGQQSATDPPAAAATEPSGKDSGVSGNSSRPKSPQEAAKQQVEDRQQQQQQQQSPQMVAEQVKSASQAAACSLVLITLLARAAVPVLQELQLSLQGLPPATPSLPGDSSSSSSSSSITSSAAAAGADAVVTELGAVDLLSGLMFVRAAYQALCARCYLSQVVKGLPAQLLGARPAAGATAADVAALKAVKGALRGEGLARGWAHLVQPVPPGVVVRVRRFQERHSGDFVADMNLLQRLLPVGLLDSSSSASGNAAAASASEEEPQHGEAAAAAPQQLLQMTGEMRQQLDALLTDLLGLFGSLLSEVPLPVGCNNPACANLEGVAEASLSVNKRCKSCLAAHYCSKQCQTEHWAAHKGPCQRIRSLAQA